CWIASAQSARPSCGRSCAAHAVTSERNSSESVVPTGARPPRARIRVRSWSERSNWPLWLKVTSPSTKGWVFSGVSARPTLARRVRSGVPVGAGGAGRVGAAPHARPQRRRFVGPVGPRAGGIGGHSPAVLVPFGQRREQRQLVRDDLGQRSRPVRDDAEQAAHGLLLLLVPLPRSLSLRRHAPSAGRPAPGRCG